MSEDFKMIQWKGIAWLPLFPLDGNFFEVSEVSPSFLHDLISI